MRPPRLILVTATDVVPERELVARIDAAARLPVPERLEIAVQLRDPALSGRELFALGERLRRATRTLGIGFIVNDRLELAVALEADGVHLGRRSVGVRDARALVGAGAWISVSCHAPEDVGAALDADIDAVLLSPIFASPGKGAPLGLEGLRRARALFAAHGERRRPLSLYALGGVDAGSVRSCLEAGADGVAAIRADLVSTLARSLAT